MLLTRDNDDIGANDDYDTGPNDNDG